MTKAINLGFVGGGINSAVGSTHFIAAQMDGRFKVRAGCFSTKTDVNIETAEQWGILPDQRYDNFLELLKGEKNNIDAIVVLTPTPCHTEMVAQALTHGYPVICEKALACSSADAMLIQEVQQQQQGFLAVTYNYTGYPMLRELKNMIRQEQLGKVTQIHIEMPQEGFARFNSDGRPMKPQDWRLQDQKLPTIALDLGVHLHHIVDFLTTEKPLELVATQSSHGHFKQIVDNTMCIARYTNSLECSFWYSKAALGYRNGLRVRVFGENGSAEWYQMDPELLTHHDIMGHKTIIDRASVGIEIAHSHRYNRFKSGHPAGFIEAFANLYWDIADSLEQHLQTGVQAASDYVFTAQHALEGMVMLEAIARSSGERCWEPVTIQP
ncbi:MAG: Gfo/Idh/MocA family oxidoreductase [Porticoccaceae bacterium]|nr:Gfo/Idh/MocA family oxidoreductase [Porticoccaceae bacterium]